MLLKSFRLRLVICSITLFLIGLGINYVNCYINANETYYNIEEDYDNKTFNNIYTGIMSSIKDFELMSEYICYEDSIDYVTKFYNVMDGNLADSMLASVNRQANMLEISPKIINKYFLLPITSLQKGFSKEIGVEKTLNEALPNYEQLLKSNILREFKGNFSYIEDKPEIMESIYREYKDNPKECKVIENFYNEIKNKNIYFTMDKGSFLLVVILNDNFLNKYVSELKDQSRELAVIDDYGRLFWSSSQKAMKKVNELLADKKLSKKETLLKLEHKGNVTISKKLGYTGLRVFYIAPNTGFLHKAMPLVAYNSIYSVLCLLLVMVLSYIMSSKVLRPISTLTKSMELALYQGEISYLDKGASVKEYTETRPYKRKIIVYFIVTAIIPILFNGLLIAKQSYSFISHKTKNDVLSASVQMRENVIYQIEHYESLINVISASDIFAEVSKKYQNIDEVEKKLLDIQLSKKIASIFDISYFVVLNDSGVAKYQTIYSNNALNSKDSNGKIYKFSIDAKKVREGFSNSSRNITWVENFNDIFNNKVLALFKKINDTYEKNTGYLQMVLKENAMHPVRTDFKMDFVLTDSKGNIFYDSSNDINYSMFASQIIIENKCLNGGAIEGIINGRSNIAVKQQIPFMDWNMIVFERLDDILARSFSLTVQILLVTGFICIVAFIVALYLASVLVKPINELKNDMNKIISNKTFESSLDYKGCNEIGQLVQVYNMLIKNIKQLIDENISSKTREQELLTLKTQAELNMLQQQINPHFLYNTLEVINMHVRQADRKDASKMIEALAQVFRFSTRTDSKIVTLEQEINHVKNYLIIQKARYDNKFDIKWDIGDNTLNIKVLKLIVQPIVENSINHGLYEYTSGGILNISSRLKDEFLILEVSDNGIGMNETELKSLKDKIQSDEIVDTYNSSSQKSGNGIALRNVYKRLQIYYQSNAKMEILSKPFKGTTVIFSIPFDTNS